MVVVKKQNRQVFAYYSTAIFTTYSKGKISCPIEFLGTERLSDKEFETYANSKLNSIEAKLKKYKKLELVDINGQTHNLFDKDTYMLNVSTFKMLVHDETKESKGVIVIEFNNSKI